MRVVQVSNLSNGLVLGDQIALATTTSTRMIGLLGKSGLRAGEGLWIQPCSGIHTIGMRFAIDVIGLDKHHRVIRLWEHLQPNRFTSLHLSLRGVIELPAGRIAECGLQIGDQLVIPET